MCGPKTIHVAVYVLVSAAMQMSVRSVARGAEPAAASPAAAPAVDGVLMLQDGGVLSGRIAASGDRYVVTQGGAEISVARVNVAYVGRSLADAYDARRQIAPPSAEAHVTLAEWCLRYGLYPQAAEELQSARAKDPRDARVELLERRLAVLSRPRSEPAVSSAASVSSSAPRVAPQQAVRGIDELPTGAVEQFTRRVQPLLVNNCTNAGCHRPGGGQSFQLDRALVYGMANRRTTMQNLAAVLALVDRQRPQESRLLTVPRRDHGGMNRPIFGPRQERQLEVLVEWVGLVASADAVERNVAAPEKGSEVPTGSIDASVDSPLPRWREPVAPASYDEADDVEGVLATPVRFGTRLQVWQPKDPFDPEIFNRDTRERGGADGRGHSNPANLRSRAASR